MTMITDTEATNIRILGVKQLKEFKLTQLLDNRKRLIAMMKDAKRALQDHAGSCAEGYCSQLQEEMLQLLWEVGGRKMGGKKDMSGLIVALEKAQEALIDLEALLSS